VQRKIKLIFIDFIQAFESVNRVVWLFAGVRIVTSAVRTPATVGGVPSNWDSCSVANWPPDWETLQSKNVVLLLSVKLFKSLLQYILGWKTFWNYIKSTNKG